MKLKKCIAMLLVIMVIAGSMVFPANATDREPITIDETEIVSKTANFSEDSDPSCGEITQVSMNALEAQASFTETIKNCSTIKSSNLNCVERVFNCNLSVASAEQILVQETDQVYTRYTCKDKTELSFDENGDLFKISTIYAETTPRIEYAVRKIAQSSGLSEKEAKKQCLDIMPEIRAMFNITDDYPLTDEYDFDEEYVFYTFEKLLENGVYNPYQSVKVVFNKRLGKFSIARKFDSSPNALTPRVDEQSALLAAEEYIGGGISFEQVKLTYIDQSHCDFESANRKIDKSVCYLVYKVSSAESNFVVYIDALNGKCIGTDIIMAENGAAFGIKESNDSKAYNYTFGTDKNGEKYEISNATIAKWNGYMTSQVMLSAAAMRRLGYNTSSSLKGNSTLISSMRNYLQNDSKAYAFYFTGHGSPNVLGFKTNGWIRPSDVTGNWHFVFLNACSTAADTGWADAFHINGYSRRAFLGWSKSVTYDNAYLFAAAFWPRLKANVSVRQAAVDAANDVEGDGTTPIRFYGDRSYDGRSYN